MIVISKISKRTSRLCLFVLLLFANETNSQGLNHTWLLGYIASDTLMRINFDSSSATLVTEIRKMPVQDTQGNISDENGNFLMSSNGIWIANSMGDTMPNGNNLNPGFSATSLKSLGMVVLNGNIILPMPGDTNKFVMFHQTLADFTNYAINIFYTVIDKTLDGGKGDVITKNNVALSGAFGYGMTACKHGNGRDWWIVALNNTGNIIHKFLLSPNNVQYIGNQNLNVPAYGDWSGQPVFSPDGNKFAYRHGYGTSSNWNQNMRLFQFDRCNANFILDTIVDYTDSLQGYGACFSPNSRYLYFDSYQHLYQFDTDSTSMVGSLQIVATNDTHPSPSPPFYTNFHSMYLAANGKIYITSSNGVIDLHYINFPDSANTSCDVHLHDFHLPKFNARSVPVHPNYYLGRKIGSQCDTLTSINDLAEHDFRFSISPNPSNGNFKIIYLLPQNKKGTLHIFDVTGKEVYKQNLPQWSTLQNISLPKLSSGVYNCTITSAGERVNKKLVILFE
jgi:hypothetical protein